MTPAETVRQQARELADQLLDDLKSGRRAVVGLAHIELAARDIAPRDPHDDYFRTLVDWTVRELVERAAK